MNTKTFLHRTATILLIAMMLFAAVPAAPAGALSQNITSVNSGSWESGAWPDTQRSGTITVTSGSQNVTGVGTAFLTELSVGNILKTTATAVPPLQQIGTVVSILSDTELILSNIPGNTRENIDYSVQGVGPADNVTIANGHTVDIAANVVNQTGTVTVNAGGTLNVSKIGTIFSTLTVNGTVLADEDADFGALIVNNGGSITAVGTAGILEYTALSLTINTGGAANISRNFTVDSTTSISGTINFGSTTTTSRVMTFTGPVTLNSGATWSEPASGNGANNSYNFSSDFTNNAAVFSASSASATHSFSGNDKTLNGSTAIAKVDVAGTYTNNGTLTIGVLSGLGALTNSAAGTLNLGGSVSINTLANAGTLNKTDGGSISTALANFTNTGTINLNSTGTITGGITNNAGGVVNIAGSGAITAFDNATATSLLNISALSTPSFTNLIVTMPGNTVEYSGEGDQTVKSTTYSNLVLSGSGNKLISLSSNSTLANGNLSITETAKANIPGDNLAVNSLTLGGVGTIDGTWGSTGSGADNIDDTFFAANTGYVTVATDTRSAQTISFTSTPPTNAAVGGTYTPTADATSGLPVTFTIAPSASSVCSIAGGLVTFNANGTCLINANQAGDNRYLAAPQVQQSITVKTNQTINFTSTPPSPAEVGGTYTPTATATSGLPVTLTIDPSASSICSISAGVVSFTTAGTCVINANQAGDATFNPAPQVQQSFLIGFKETNLHVSIGGTEMSGSPFTLVEGTSVYKKYTGINNGPVKIESADPILPIMAAERVVYKFNGVPTSLSEKMALPNNQLFNVYWLPWYTNNQTQQTQLRITNVSTTTATIRVWIGGRLMPGSPFTLAKGRTTNKVYLIDQGPVKIESTVNILASQRVIYKSNNVNKTSFSELTALPANRLNKIYWLPWYNSKTLDTQLLIGNTSTSTATVRVFIGGKPMGASFTLASGTSILKTYPGLDKGPVKIVSNVSIVASERMIYKVGAVPVSYSEVMALPQSQLDTIYWLPFYTKTSAVNTHLQFANVSASQATVRVYINGTKVSEFNLAAGTSIRKTYALGTNSGPVKIESNVKILVSTRSIYKVNGKPTSYSEMLALPNKLLDSIYWLPWYDNKTMNTQLLIGMK